MRREIQGPARDRARSNDGWPRMALLLDSKIDDARRTLRTQTRAQVLAELDKLRKTLDERLDEVIKKEIDALSELHYL